MKVGIREVKAKCSAVMELAHNGQRIVVTKHGAPYADIVPHKTRKRKIEPLPGITGHISITDAVAPLDEEELARWE